MYSDTKVHLFVSESSTHQIYTKLCEKKNQKSSTWVAYSACCTACVEL